MSGPCVHSARKSGPFPLDPAGLGHYICLVAKYGANMKRPRKIIERVYEGFGPYYNFIFGKLLFQEGRETAIGFLDIKKGHKVLEV